MECRCCLDRGSRLHCADLAAVGFANLYFSDLQFGCSAIDLNNADKDKAIELIVQGESKDLLIYQIN